VWDHLFEAGFSKLAFVASAFVFGRFDGGVEVEGVPGDVEVRVRMTGLMCCDSFFEAAFADKTPGADLLTVSVIEGRGIRCLKRFRS
jgi:hypothetical protein